MKRVVTFYRFVPLADPHAWRIRLNEMATGHGLKGTILLAEEGVNATLAGEERALRAFAGEVVTHEPFADMSFRYSGANATAEVFLRLKVTVKPEIVSFGRPGLGMRSHAREAVDADRWHELLDDPAVVVVDTRNRYETDIGGFPGALAPDTGRFREFPQFVARSLPDPAQPVAMYCTGGIRCEKASAYLIEQGFDQVYQLRGGVLGYLGAVAPAESRWLGECFVFDQRVSVTAQLAPGSYEQCHACRRPICEKDKLSTLYRPGVSCPRCASQHDARRRASFAERRRQVALARSRGGDHLGPFSQSASSSDR